ncbi:porin family protein [bacterium]|nr:porin family protein [bacterium]
MKKLRLLGLTGLLLVITTTAKAQFSAGAGLDYGSEVEEVGLDLRAGFAITEKATLAADFSFFNVDENGPFEKRRFWNDFNVNLNYYFLSSEEIVQPYGLVGLNITSVGVKYDDHPAFDDDREGDTELGVNFGGGLDIKATENLRPFAEVKYLIIDKYDQGAITVGLKYFFQ